MVSEGQHQSNQNTSSESCKSSKMGAKSGGNPLLSFFWDLVSVKESVRRSTVVSMIKYLRSSQKQFISGMVEPVKPLDCAISDESVLDQVYSADVTYSVKRLMRGLPSSREAARQGFALALTELLIMLDEEGYTFPLACLFSFVDSNLQVSGGMKGQEEKEMYFGQLFAYVTVLKSGSTLWKYLEASPSSVSSILVRIHQVGGKKSFLAELGANIIMDMICDPLFPREKCEPFVKEFVVSAIVPKESPESIFMLLKLQNQVYSEWKWSTLLDGTWKHGNILHRDNLNHLKDVLKGSLISHPNIHSVWTLIFDLVFAASSNNNSDVLSFFQCWKGLVDEELFGGNGHDQKYLGFMLFEQILTKLVMSSSAEDGESENNLKEFIPLLFTKNLSRTLFNHLHQKDNRLNKAAIHVMDSCAKLCKASTSTSFMIIMGLLACHPSSIDQLSKSKMLDSLLEGLTDKGVEEYVRFLLGVAFCDPASLHKLQRENVKDEEYNTSISVPSMDHQRNWVIDQIVSLLRNQKIPKNDETHALFAEFIVKVSFFKVPVGTCLGPKGDSSITLREPISEKFAVLLRKRFNSILLVHLNMSPDWHARYANLLLEESKQWGLVLFESEASRENSAAIKSCEKRLVKALGTLKKDLNKKSSLELTLKRRKSAFETLLLHALVSLYLSPSEGLDMASDILECYEKTFATAKKSTKKAAAADEEDEDINPIDVLVDLLVSFLSKESALWRKIALETFKAFCMDITEEGLDILMQVILAMPSAAGDIMEEDEAADNEDANMEESDDDDDIEDGGFHVVDPELRKKIQEALGEDKEEEELPDMNDDEMVQMDSKLAAVFSEKKKLKQESKQAKTQMIHFKLRVLDLLAIYMSQRSTLPELELNRILLVLGKVLQPMMELYATCLNSKDTELEVLAGKVKAFLLHYVHKMPVPKNLFSDKPEKGQEFLALIHSLAVNFFDQAKKSPAHKDVVLYQRALSSTMFALVKMMMANPVVSAKKASAGKKKKTEDSSAGITSTESLCSFFVQKFGDALDDYLGSRHSQVSPSLFHPMLKMNQFAAMAIPTIVPNHLMKLADCNYTTNATEGTKERKAFSIVKAWTMIFELLSVTTENSASLWSKSWLEELSQIASKNRSAREELSANREYEKIIGSIGKKLRDCGRKEEATLFVAQTVSSSNKRKNGNQEANNNYKNNKNNGSNKNFSRKRQRTA